MSTEPEPLMAAKFSMPMRVSAEDLAFAEEIREHERRMAAMTPEQRAERKAQQDAQRAAAFAEAVASWQLMCDRLAGNATALAVLDIHKPSDLTSWLSCSHCLEGADGDPVEWPCRTFEAVRDTP